MKAILKLTLILSCTSLLSGCLATSIVGGAVSAVTTTVGAAVDVVDAVTPDIID